MTDTDVRDPRPGDYVRMTGTCMAVETIQPPAPPPESWYVFERIGGRYEVRLNGKFLMHGCSFNDFYGRESAVESAVAEAKAYAAREGIAGPGPLAVVALRLVMRGRAKKSDRGEKNLYAPGFPTFERFERVGEEETIVWSSAEESRAGALPNP